MRRKDGKPQTRALRNKPIFKVGFKDSKNAIDNNFGDKEKPYQITSFFSGCGGLDFGFKGGFSILGKHYEPLPFNITHRHVVLRSEMLLQPSVLLPCVALPWPMSDPQNDVCRTRSPSLLQGSPELPSTCCCQRYPEFPTASLWGSEPHTQGG